MCELRDQVVIVTGASRGLGSATARALAQAGSKVVLAARSIGQIEALASALESEGLQALAVPTDVTDAKQVDDLMARTLGAFGRIDVLINNAGFNRAKPFEQVTPDDYDAVMGTNMRGVFLCTRAAYSHMLERKSGTIVNVGSVLSLKAVPGCTIYGAAKFAVLGFSRSLMMEAKEHNIRVIAFLPGGMATSWYDHNPDIDTSWMMKADSVARILVNTLDTPADLNPYEVIVAPRVGSSWP